MSRHVSPDLNFEIPLWQSGFQFVAGLDEAGRGAWAGPVSAGAVVLPPDPTFLNSLPGVRDSKQMTPLQRAKWAAVIKGVVLAWGVGFATHQEIDQMGIVPATRLAMERALGELLVFPDFLLVDALRLPHLPLPQNAIIKGDSRSLSIAAASVLAKTERDLLMRDFDIQFPGYGFARHKGYGTAAHRAALDELGITKIHRCSFAPVKEIMLRAG
jgi:ribonuclease HII